MVILNKVIKKEELGNIEDKMYFEDMCMIKSVIDVDRELVALNAELHGCRHID